jgi:Arc/MetJ-type ribon-helix-helix transcriptional regulator
VVTSIVSVRMPSSLVQKLRELAKDNHFLDISEEVRSIIKIEVRRYKLRLGEIKPIEEEKPMRAEKIDFKTENTVKEELVRRLKRIIEEIEHE